MGQIFKIWSLVQHYRNWYTLFLNHFGLIRTTYLTVRLRNRVTFRARSGTNDFGVINEIWAKDHYNPSGYEMRAGDIAVDIGAHIGAFSVLAALSADDIAVYSFEPFPDSFALLEENLDRNQVNNVRVFQIAVAGRPGTQRLYGPGNDTTGHSLRVYGTEFLDVRCLTIDEIFNTNNIQICNLLKMDCEGAEYDIFFNATDELFRRIERLVIEYHPHIDDEPNTYSGEGLCALLESKGFVLEPINRPVKPRSSGLIYGKRQIVTD